MFFHIAHNGTFLTGGLITGYLLFITFLPYQKYMSNIKHVAVICLLNLWLYPSTAASSNQVGKMLGYLSIALSLRRLRLSCPLSSYQEPVGVDAIWCAGYECAVVLSRNSPQILSIIRIHNFDLIHSVRKGFT